MDRLGNVYVTDFENNRVQVFSAKGEFLKKWVSFGRADSQFQSPRGIAVDTNGNMYVADWGNNRGAGLRGRAALRWTWPAESP